MGREAALREDCADFLGRAARKIEQGGDTNRAEAMRFTCRKIRVQAMLDRCKAVTADAKARDAS